MKNTLIALSLAAFAAAASAQATPAGLWKTIDDETKTEKSLVRVTDNGGIFSGKIEKLMDPAKANAVCEKCSDERKDQAIMGMTIIRAVKHNPDDAELWDGGDILDPNNGKVYKVRLKPVDGGKKLEVRGYIGAPLFGRTQTWIRVE
ncbi:DUF2147 domain-containing protein [Ideonella azotifigens]|uniref:DUF2147 domain-containing protein n=1 Tax=Ideonella azotifigens TaxID=513160 RepID=A0ABN1KJL6_9BURK|nr:DUF2147 domain-containing protein [Ideonella azotifigens]MCD2339373.1 DUF2147 domain-containing protein [Ideonella azotifigens]